MTKIQILDQEISLDKFDDSQLPTDVHIVSYEINGELYVDAVRAYTKVDIFDEYYDKLKERGGLIKEIKSGFGRIKPKLYGKIKDES